MKDKIQIKVKGGKGGDGILAFTREQKADGGDGGNGGDVILKGNINVKDYWDVVNNKSNNAGNGSRGERHHRKGSNGEDCVINVPLVTKVYEGERLLVEITKHGEEFVVCKGGNGGLGNYTLRGKGREGKMSRTVGLEPEERTLKLELNLRSDIIFLGLPNAGKSSLINSLTRAKYKVAPYEFTTLEPQLAVMDGLILMDLPGLIEGTFKGKGLGTDFIKHTKYSKVLVHCISLENEDLYSTYKLMREEFERIDQGLSSLPEIVVLTKSDIFTTDVVKEKEKEFKGKYKGEFLSVSSYLEDSLIDLKKRLITICS